MSESPVGANRCRTLSAKEITGLVRLAGTKAANREDVRLQNFFRPKGYVLERRANGDQNIIRISLGKDSGITEDQKATFYAVQEDKHPITGNISYIHNEIGDGKVTNKIFKKSAWVLVDDNKLASQLILKLPNNITFDTDSDILKPKFEPVLKSITSVLTEYNSTLITSIGHTDNVGSVAHNQGLSKRRADSLINYLTASGINTHRLTSIGRGQFQPIASNDTVQGRAQNRRVEIMLEALQQ